MTDLSYGRGGSPLQNLIVRGYKDTMISALWIEKELDSGAYTHRSGDLNVDHQITARVVVTATRPLQR